MRKAILFVLVGLLSGCAQYQRQEYVDARPLAQAVVKQACDQAAANPGFDPIRAQIPADSRKATIAQLNDPHYPNARQKEALSHYDEYASECINQQVSYLSLYAPTALPIYQQGQQEGKIRLAALAAGKMTFGQYNTERAKAVAKTWAEMQQADNARAAQAQQLYLQQQAVRQQELQNNINIMRAFTPPRPTTTNCYQFGQMVNCTTQ